jgi:hypothetical protein
LKKDTGKKIDYYEIKIVINDKDNGKKFTEETMNIMCDFYYYT